MSKSVLALVLVTVAGSVAAQTATPPMTPPSTSAPEAVPPASPPGVSRPNLTPPSVATTPPAARAGLAGEAQARARIERDGFTGVSGLTRGPDGAWRGTAMRGSTSVQVMVDARGDVTTE